jgi:hypothetical protein
MDTPVSDAPRVLADFAARVLALPDPRQRLN